MGIFIPYPYETKMTDLRGVAERIGAMYPSMKNTDIEIIESMLKELVAEAKLDAMHLGGDAHMCEEAVKRSQAKTMFDNTVGDDDTDRRIKEARVEMREEAAQIAADCNIAHDCEGAFVAAKIRALKP